MSLVRIVVWSFACDECGEVSGDIVSGGDTFTAADAFRTSSETRGWSVRSGKHFCPTCKPRSLAHALR